MNLLKHIYKTKTLSEYGAFLLVSLVLVLILGNLFIPDFKPQNIDTQLIKLKGKHFKFSDDPHVIDFIRSVKRNGGYICMGTSESTPKKDGNYYDFLDMDTSYSTRFSILAGAGWTAGLRMPMLLNYPKEVDSLNIIYFINPVYWQTALCKFDKGYWTRYLNYGTYKRCLNQNNTQLLLDISEEYSQVLNPGEKFLYWTEYYLRKIRKPFFQDLRYWLFPEGYVKDLSYLAEDKSEIPAFDFFGVVDTAYIDTSLNISYDFSSRRWLNPISDSDYRYNELKAFIKLCKELNVNVTFVLGPVNEIYIGKYNPAYLDEYIETSNNIRNILMEEGSDYIDASDLGNIPGSFQDNQHHSSYGAYLIYQKIKNHLHEKDHH